VDAVAARAGVGKAAIYRRFGSKAELAFAVAQSRQSVVPLPDTGSLHGDLRALARGALLLRPEDHEVLAPLIAEVAHNPELRARFQQTFIATDQDTYIRILDRARQRGELTGPVEPIVGHLLLAGPLITARLVLHQPVDDAILDALVTAVVAGLSALASQTRTATTG